MKKYTTKRFEETQKLGEKIAKKILARNLQKNAMVLGLQGDLGAGKTTFLQGFAKGLGIKEKINSPTFVIMKKFKIPATTHYSLPTTHYKYFYHIDCYRLNTPKEILQLGFKEIILNPENIVAIEWPEKISKILPKETTVIVFEHLKENKRALTFYT